MQILEPKFPLGQIVVTPGIKSTIPDAVAQRALIRHQHGDWGDVDSHDRQANYDALAAGERLLSVYHHEATKFWIITEADRSVTTVLLPDEY